MSVSMICRYDVDTPMRDGTLLRGDLFLPEGSGKWPVLLMRTVFRKDVMGRAFGAFDPRYFVSRGYAVFIQDVRGLGASEGAFDRFTADGTDGYDTVEWLAQQSFCSGRVGMFGEYYAGYLQLMAAYEAPPHLYAICPIKTSVSINRDCDNRGFLFSSHIGWCMSRQIHRLAEGRYDAETTQKYLPLLQKYLKSYIQDQVSAVPLRSMPVLQNTPFPLIRSYFHHLVEGYDNLSLIQKEGRGKDVSAITIPAFYISGWYDSARTPLLDHCMAQRQAGVDSRVLVAPWQPGEPMACADGALDNYQQTVDIQQEMLQWFDHWLKDKEAPSFAPVRIADPASGQSYAGDAWPPVSHDRLLYPSKNGLLVSQAIPDPFTVQYHHNPSEPLLYRGYGATVVNKPSESLLIFTAQPLQEALLLAGPVRVELCLSSTVQDADVMVTLSHISPDNKRFILCDGATRARYADGWNSVPLQPNEIRNITVRMGHLFACIPQGHSLCLEISGSAFPKYDINHGTGLPPADDATLLCSINTIHGGGSHPFRLILPAAHS